MTHDYSKVPQELKELKRWCVFRLVSSGKPDPKRPGKEKFEKPPFQSLHPEYGCSSTNSDHWSTFDQAVACVNDSKNKMDGIGFVLGDGFAGADADRCLDTNGIPSEETLLLWKDLPETYTEISPSGDGLHKLWFSDAEGHAKQGNQEFYTDGRYFTVTGRAIGSHPIFRLSKEQASELINRIKALKPAKVETGVTVQKADAKVLLLMDGKWKEAGYPSQSEADQWFCGHLLRLHKDIRIVDRLFRATGLFRRKWDEQRGEKTYGQLTLQKALEGLGAKNVVDPGNWRAECKSFGQLSSELPRFLLSGLVPAKAFTALCAPSYNCKTWFALAQALAISTGKSLWCFEGPAKPVPCVYHVPEMNEALIRQYMALLGFDESEMFLVRPMEVGMWSLDDPRMLRSSEGRMVFFDTAGYFNPAEDAASYQQSLKFATLVFNLLQNGAEGVEGLFHPPKYAKQEDREWTLENSILGSAGYGGILRSCLRIENLNKDKNDPNVWVYVEGMKNPGLKPFQLEGPLPLKMKVLPGESPYRRDLDHVKVDPRKALAFRGFDEGTMQKDLVKELRVSKRDLARWRKEWENSKFDREKESVQ